MQAIDRESGGQVEFTCEILKHFCEYYVRQLPLIPGAAVDLTNAATMQKVEHIRSVYADALVHLGQMNPEENAEV
jgi:hypothetical protein